MIDNSFCWIHLKKRKFDWERDPTPILIIQDANCQLNPK
jgi:hypothetical protein